MTMMTAKKVSDDDKNAYFQRKRKFEGRTFLVTRTAEGNKVEREKLEVFGAQVIELPLIEIKAPSNPSKLEDQIKKIEQFDWIVFTSANGVRIFFSKFRDLAKLEGAKFACVGPETQRALEAFGFKASLVPSEFLTRRLGQELARLGLKGKRVLLARAEEANPEIGEVLREAGAIVVETPVYRTEAKKLDNLNEEFLLQKNITDITLSSPSTVKGLLLNFPPEKFRSTNVKIHCIGPVTADSARKAGLEVVTVAKVHTIDGMIWEIA